MGFFFFSVGETTIGKCPCIYHKLPGVVSSLPGDLLGGKTGPILANYVSYNLHTKFQVCWLFFPD